MTPDWAPNIHPMVVHFPIALLVAACVVDALALLFRRQRVLRTGAALLYVAGALATVAGFLSGRQAADLVQVSGAANTVLTDHADWAAYAVWFFAAYGLVRLLLWWKVRGVFWSVAAFVVGAAGLVLVFETAERGARLVYEHGVGVARVQALEAELAQRVQALADADAPRVAEDGSWSWYAGPYAAESFRRGFRLWSDSNFAAETRADSALALTLQDTVLFFVLDAPFGSVQIDAALDYSEFTGSVRLVHNAQDARNYAYAEIEGNAVRQAVVRDGMPDILDEQTLGRPATGEIRVVSDRTHFRAYVNGELAVHGHGPAPGTGSVGLRLQGTGTLLLASLRAQALR